MLKVYRYTNISELPSGCEDFFYAAEQHSFDLSADWFQLLVSKVFSESSTRIYVMQRDGEVRGVLPLYFQKTAAGFRQARGLANYYSSLFRPLLDATVTPDELAAYLLEISRDLPFDVLRFDAMDPEHPAFNLLESAMRQAGLVPFRFMSFGNWYLPVGGRSFQAYFQGLPSRVRNTVRRREKKFFATERGKLEIVTGNDGLEAAIIAWKKIYAASWKQAESSPEFVEGMIRMYAARGWLRLGIACCDGEPIACQIWIVSHGRAAIYKLAYDEDFSHLSAGTILTSHLMRHVLDVDRVQEVDYLIGDDEYKKDWMSHRRERWGIVAYNLSTLRGKLGWMNELSRRYVKAVWGYLRRFS